STRSTRGTPTCWRGATSAASSGSPTRTADHEPVGHGSRSNVDDVNALNALSDWPVDNAAGALVTDAGVVATHGDVDRVYELASVTKLLVSRAVLVAVEEEAIALDEPAGPPGATVAHLLAHASGIAFDS